MDRETKTIIDDEIERQERLANIYADEGFDNEVRKHRYTASILLSVYTQLEHYDA